MGEGGFEPPKALPADLQSVPFGHSGIPPYSVTRWSWWTDSNPRPADYKSAALPTELHQHFHRPDDNSKSNAICQQNFFDSGKLSDPDNAKTSPVEGCGMPLRLFIERNLIVVTRCVRIAVEIRRDRENAMKTAVRPQIGLLLVLIMGQNPGW